MSELTTKPSATGAPHTIRIRFTDRLWAYWRVGRFNYGRCIECLRAGATRAQINEALDDRVNLWDLASALEGGATTGGATPGQVMEIHRRDISVSLFADALRAGNGATPEQVMDAIDSDIALPVFIRGRKAGATPEMLKEAKATVGGAKLRKYVDEFWSGHSHGEAIALAGS